MSSSTIWKYPLEITDGPQQFQVPSGFRFLHVGEQTKGHSGLSFWLLVDPSQPLTELTLSVVGTGEDIEENPYRLWHFGTVVMSNGFVWHVFAHIVPMQESLRLP